MTMLAGWLTNSFRSTYNHPAGYNLCSSIFIQTRDYAARKGTREKARKKKVKATVEKIGFIARKRDSKAVKATISPLRTIDESWKRKAIDNVWITKYHQQPVYSLSEAIEYHREMHHPTMLNEPNAPLNAFIELDMRHEKKNRFVENFSKVIDTPHIFKYNEDKRKVLAFCTSLKEQENAKNAGADFVGGVNIIKQIQNGEFVFKEFDYIVAHADILTDLLLIRGLLRKKFPNIKTGTLGNNMSKLVAKFKSGIQYTAIPDQIYKEYGQVNVIFGLLSMDTKQLDENFHALINSIESLKPKPEGFFIQRVQVRCEPSKESFKINFKEYLPNIEEEIAEQEENIAVISTH